MIKKIIILLNISAILIVSSCDSDKKNNITYFGGKIINPKSNQVILYSQNIAIDTFYLDENDKFFSELKNVSEGLYYFFHGNENQYIYLEPQDSLMLRLNTWDFDESLVYAGEGAERNNMLIDCFLEDEKESRVFYQFNKLPPKKFKLKVDSILKIKMATYQDYVDNHPEETEAYNETLKIALTYPLYSRLERYPMMNVKYNKKDNFPKMENSFYSFRNKIKRNKDSLMYYPPYSRYTRSYLYNKTYSLGHLPTKNSYTPSFTSDLLGLIDEKIKLEKTKNAFLRQTVISHFYNKSTCDFDTKPFDTFFKISTSEEDKLMIKNLIQDTKAIHVNHKLPSFKLVDFSNTELSINKLLKNKNSFIFFWHPDYVSELYFSSRINFLIKNYPNIDFLIVNIDDKNPKRVNKIDIKNQFYLKPNSDAHKFLTSKMPRSILVNNKGKVINGYASISSNNVNKYLKELNNN
ncbi:hypothetical protein [Polaribacter porphyrae]|uniref:Thioredoxin domain-containing protein n=1 Tax=Polaribacter porphyrae TaxID=1137780 RepID=A0A2S7WM90_9FLAO|nr:hypothetical protein [Polaribacter porphyrae]PQJ78401.1 hypothetical protein BTO18_03985 [Polaribacter porphyrae]